MCAKQGINTEWKASVRCGVVVVGIRFWFSKWCWLFVGSLSLSLFAQKKNQRFQISLHR